jgi:predicted nucleic acid-binding protein
MGTLIDSSVLIAWERDRLDLEAHLAGYAEEDFAISAITASELLHGDHAVISRTLARFSFAAALYERKTWAFSAL